MTSTRAIQFESSPGVISLLQKPVHRLGIERDAHGKCGALTLRHGQTSGVRIVSGMHDVAEKCEVGVLCFEEVGNETFNGVFTDFPTPLLPREIWKLEIEEAETLLESGIRFFFTDDRELVILPADFPFFLSILGNCVPVINPRSEYDLDEYQQTKIYDSAEAR